MPAIQRWNVSIHARRLDTTTPTARDSTAAHRSLLAARLGRSATVPHEVCVKISSHMDGWVREAYFGLLLKDHPRAIQVYDL